MRRIRAEPPTIRGRVLDRVNHVRGTIADGGGRPFPDASVVVFSSDRSRWYDTSRYVRTTLADADGAFDLPGLAAGTYYAVAVGRLPDEGPDGWRDPELLDALRAAATTVTLGEGQKVSLRLRAAVR
jgi:hypothetical protein